MATYRVSLDDLPGRIASDMKAREGRIQKAIMRTAEQGVKVVQSNMPVAFGGLKESTHAVSRGQGAAIEVDDPNAAAVEVGSRPHWPPLEPIVRWVKLRGMQGLKSSAAIDKLPGTTTAGHARMIAGQLRAMQTASTNYGAAGNHLSVDAPIKIAQAIRAAIGRNGTKPHWFAQNSLPTIVELLDVNVKEALEDKD